MSNEAPTDSLRLVLDDHEVIKRCVERMPPLYMRGQTEGPYLHSDIAGLIDIIGRLAAAPASPLPGGGPTCQLCSSKIEGWICQGCGSYFCENDAGALVLNNISAAPTGDA